MDRGAAAARAAPAASILGSAQNAFASIMFLDIKGSSTMIEALEPEAAAELLDGIHSRFTRYIRRFGGHVVAFQGDGLLAIFGAPETREDHAVRALLAAVAIREEAVRQPAGQPLTVRIGIHSGDVFIRSVRTDFSVDFDAMGLTVHVAKRLEEVAEDNAIHTSHATYRLARHQFDFENLGSVALRGMTHAIQAFRVLGFRRAPEGDARDAAGQRPMVGREFELAALSRTLSLALGGRGQALVLLGEAGIGKSRLAQELAEMATGHGAVAVVHEEVMQGLAHSYSAVRRLLASLDAVAKADMAASSERLFYDRREIVFGTTDSVRETDGSLPAATKGPAVSPTDLDRQLRADLLAGLERTAKRHPLVLIVDDAQWVDPESLEILLQTIALLGDAPVLVLICSRDLSAMPRFADAGNISFLRIEPLAREPSLELFRDLARGSLNAATLDAHVGSVTGGNPLFIEELAFAASMGRFSEANASELLADQEIEPGGRIRSIILDRIHHLDADVRLMLQCAALVQFDCGQELLTAVTDLGDASRASTAIETLRAAGYLRRSQVGDQLVFGVRHSLLRQIVERGIVKQQRRRLHRRIREVLGWTLDQSFEILAHHATSAGDWERATGDWREAGVRALEASLYRHAASCFEHALDAAAHDPDGDRRSRRQNEIRMRLRLCLAPLGDYRRLYFHLNQVSHSEASAEDLEARLQVLVTLSHVENICGNVRLSRAKATEARRLAASMQQRGAYIAATYFLAQALEFGADYAACTDMVSHELTKLLESERHERFQLTGTASVLFASLLSHAYAFQNDAANAERHGQLAVDIAAETQRPFDLGIAHFGLGWGRLVLGRAASAMPCFETAMSHVAERRLRLLESMIDCRLRYLRIVVGGEPLAVVQPEQACQEAADMPHIWCWSNLLWAMAEMHEGRLDRAARIVGDTIPVARANHYRGAFAWAYGVTADIGFRSSAPGQLAVGHRARQIVEKTGLAWKFADAGWMHRELSAHPA
jgi:class 3 adenylate cyclase/tetratricopeptide (TPR) repeat protein